MERSQPVSKFAFSISIVGVISKESLVDLLRGFLPPNKSVTPTIEAGDSYEDLFGDPKKGLVTLSIREMKSDPNRDS